MPLPPMRGDRHRANSSSPPRFSPPQAASALLAAQEESATYLKEVEAVGSEYERVQGQARDLLASVAALDENVAGLEKDKARLGEELAAAAGDVTRAREEVRGRGCYGGGGTPCTPYQGWLPGSVTRCDESTVLPSRFCSLCALLSVASCP